MKKYLASESGNHIKFLQDKGFDCTHIRTLVDIEAILNQYEKKSEALANIAKQRVEQAVKSLSDEEKSIALIFGCETFVSIKGKIITRPEDRNAAFDLLNQHKENTVVVNTYVYSVGLHQNASQNTIIQTVYEKNFSCRMSFDGLTSNKANDFAKQGVADSFFEGYNLAGDFIIDHCDVYQGDFLPFGLPWNYLKNIAKLHDTKLKTANSRKKKLKERLDDKAETD